MYCAPGPLFAFFDLAGPFDFSPGSGIEEEVGEGSGATVEYSRTDYDPSNVCSLGRCNETFLGDAPFGLMRCGMDGWMKGWWR